MLLGVGVAADSECGGMVVAVSRCDAQDDRTIAPAGIIRIKRRVFFIIRFDINTQDVPEVALLGQFGFKVFSRRRDPDFRVRYCSKGKSHQAFPSGKLPAALFTGSARARSQR